MLVALTQYDVGLASWAFELVALAVLAGALGYLAWHAEPAYIFCGALLLAPFNGNWEAMGLPSWASFDRLLLLVGVAVVLLRAPAVRDRPRLKMTPVHWLMVAAGAWAIASAAFSGTLGARGPVFRLLEAYGLVPFAVFAVAPLVFRTARERDLLLKAFVVLGAYLSLTTLFDALHLDALVWPKYILDPHYGTHAGRGRGPFVEAVTNGFALYVCAVAAAIAWWRWRGRLNARWIAAVVAVLCIAGVFLCLERSVWLGALAGTVLASVAIGDAKRFVPLVVVALALGVGASLVLVPGFAQRVSARAGDQQTIWDRKNMNRAALNMIEARPLLGFGWNTFRAYNRDYFQQARDYPLGRTADLNLHSTMLTFAVELGLVGFAVWLLALITGVGGALASRGPPDLLGWRAGMLAVAAAYVIVTNFVPPSHFPSFALWLWAGVCWSNRYARAEGRPPAAAVGRTRGAH
jgi:O-antigen ligase